VGAWHREIAARDRQISLDGTQPQYDGPVPAPVCLIVNPSAGGGKAGRVAPDVERTLRDHGLQVRRVDTRDLDHARTLADAAARAGETVVALSGDGMIGVVADTLRRVPNAVLGVLPGGRGNDLARVLGIPDDPLAACAVIAHGVPRAMDVGEVGGTASGGGTKVEGQAEIRGQAFVGIASAGFDSDANRIANEAPAWLGGLVYVYGALRALWSWRPARFEIELDPPGERRAFIGYSLGAANSKTYGGGMRAAPSAMLDDGLLEVMLLERVGKLRFLTTILPKVFKGTHVQLPSVHVFRAAEVEISADRPFTMYADGDPIGELPLRVRAVRGAVSVLVPSVPTNATGADSAFSSAPLPSAPGVAAASRSPAQAADAAALPSAATTVAATLPASPTSAEAAAPAAEPTKPPAKP
jgi:YegS/Rv2252/BmrU family lipid kinase